MLLNTTSKSNAAIAAYLTIPLLHGHGGVSGGEARIISTSLPPFRTCRCCGPRRELLTFFLLLTSAGMSESAIVAVVIFLAHLVSLTLLVGSGVWFVAQHGLTTLHLNYEQPVVGGNLVVALFLGV
ncbi:MAG: hypothetical protein WKG07_18960 [Hymenobacter sp.]